MKLFYKDLLQYCIQSKTFGMVFIIATVMLLTAVLLVFYGPTADEAMRLHLQG